MTETESDTTNVLSQAQRARTGQQLACPCSISSYRCREKMQKSTLLHYIVHDPAIMA
jgi:hypothetical protein